MEGLTFKINNQELSSEQLKKVSAFLMYLVKLQSAGRVRIVSRGDNFLNLKDKLNLYGDRIEHSNLNDLLFLIGEKGRAYRKSFKANVKRKYKFFGIKCTEDKVFRYIFKKYRTLFKRSDDERIEAFRGKHPHLVDYFSSSQNEIFFLKRIAGLTEAKKLEIRDYYLVPLHHMGRIGYFNNSLFLSTTADFDIAEDFTGKLNASEKLVLLTWITYPFRKWSVAFNYQTIPNRSIKHFQLPLYYQSFFPKQKEITIKSGLFPHYILGYTKLRSNEFELNPHFFTTLKSFKRIIAEGITIDQSRFASKLKETDYADFFWLDSKGHYGDTIRYSFV